MASLHQMYECYDPCDSNSERSQQEQKRVQKDSKQSQIRKGESRQKRWNYIMDFAAGRKKTEAINKRHWEELREMSLPSVTTPTSTPTLLLLLLLLSIRCRGSVWTHDRLCLLVNNAYRVFRNRSIQSQWGESWTGAIIPEHFIRPVLFLAVCVA